MVGRAALTSSQDGANISYFFHGSKYVKISWTPDAGGDKITFGPTDTAREWKTFEQSGFACGQVDAILPIPGATNRAYFFSGSSYARIQFTPGTPQETILSKGSISSWVSLKKAGFERVDAALVVPGTTDQAYFFSGREFVRVSYKQGKGGASDVLLDGPHLIRDRWNNLGFNTVDTIIPSPTSPNRAYVFSEDRAARIVLVPGGGVDVDVGPSAAAEYWPSLHQAGFY